jgi:branched-chain amino acid transport system permease protein
MTYDALVTLPLITDNLALVPQALISGLLHGMAYALVAAGLALIWGVVDIVNFAHGEYMMVGMYVSVFAVQDFGLDPLLAVPINAVLLFALGYLTYRVLVVRVMDGSILSQILVTFGILLVLRYGALAVFGPETYLVDEFVFSGTTEVAGVFFPHGKVAIAGMSLLAFGALVVFMKRTQTGQAIRAVTQDEEAAQVVGVDVDRVRAVTWGVGLAFAGVAGGLIVTFFPLRPEFTPGTWTLIAFAVVALGGFRSVLTPIVGGVAIAELQSLGAAVLNPSFTQLAVFVAFVAALLLRNRYSDAEGVL